MEREVRGFMGGGGGGINYISNFIAKWQQLANHSSSGSKRTLVACNKTAKRLLTNLLNPHVLVPPVPGCLLLMYLTIHDLFMGYFLVQHDEIGRKEQAIYYLSKKFTKYESQYSTLEKTYCPWVWATQGCAIISTIPRFPRQVLRSTCSKSLCYQEGL